jgi:hypothetical protein
MGNQEFLAAKASTGPARAPGEADAAPSPAAAGAMEAAGGELPGALVHRLVAAGAQLERERAGAPGLLAELLAGESPREQVERLAAEPRFWTWGLAELLLDRSQHDEACGSAEAIRLAGLGLAVAERLPGERHPEGVVQDLKARAWALIGDARRLAGQLAEAEDALRLAAACLARGSGDLTLDARLLELEAALRQDRGRPGEAVALLKLAASRYLEMHEFHDLARVVARREQLQRSAPRPALFGRLALGPSAS